MDSSPPDPMQVRLVQQLPLVLWVQDVPGDARAFHVSLFPSGGRYEHRPEDTVGTGRRASRGGWWWEREPQLPLGLASTIEEQLTLIFGPLTVRE